MSKEEKAKEIRISEADAAKSATQSRPEPKTSPPTERPSVQAPQPQQSKPKADKKEG